MEITIKIDKRSKQAQAFLSYIKTLEFVKIEETKVAKTPNSVTLRSMKKTSKGIGLTKTKDTQDLMQKLLS